MAEAHRERKGPWKGDLRKVCRPGFVVKRNKKLKIKQPKIEGKREGVFAKIKET